MKNFLKKLAFATGFMIIGLALGVSGLAWANEGELTLEQQLSELTLTLKQVFLENPSPEEQAPNDYAPNPQKDAMPSGVFNPTCIDNYEEWPHSEVYKDDADWNLDFIPRGQTAYGLKNEVNQQFFDLNGDGLADYIYNFKYYYNGNGTLKTDDFACVYMNTGRGFETAYQCKSRVVYKENNLIVNKQDYWGDCAQI